MGSPYERLAVSASGCRLPFPMLDPPDCLLSQWETDPDQQLVHRAERPLFLQNPKQQGALVGSGVIIPFRHAATVFDLISAELSDTFMLLATAKDWMDNTINRTATTSAGTTGRSPGRRLC